MFHCDWSVAGRLMRQMSLTRTHHATVVGPIRFSNRSNNCRVCKINGRQLSLVRTHHATIVFSSSLRPTDDKNRMVCAGLYISTTVYSQLLIYTAESLATRASMERTKMLNLRNGIIPLVMCQCQFLVNVVWITIYQVMPAHNWLTRLVTC